MITRRKFIAQSALLTAGAFAAANCAMPRSGNAKVGIQLYSLRDELKQPGNIKGVIEKVAIAGYKEIETYGFSSKSGFLGLDTKAFKNLLNDNGLSSPSGHYGIDPYLKSGNTDELKSTIEAAQLMGQTYLIVPYLDDQFRRTPDDFKLLADKMSKVATLCKQENLQLTYHNHDFEFMPINGVMLYDVFLNNIDSSLIKFEMDLFWVVRAGQDPLTWFEKYPGRFPLVHVKDMDKAKPSLNTEVGSGSIDFKRIVAKAEKAGLKHLIVEQENFSMDPYKSITQSYNYVKNSLLPLKG